MVSKKEISIGLELTKLSVKLGQIEAQFRSLQNGEPAPEYLPAKLEKLREAKQSLKLRMSRGEHLPDDQFRKAALEVEIGRILLLLDGIL